MKRRILWFLNVSLVAGFFCLFLAVNTSLSSEICITKDCPSGNQFSLTFRDSELVVMKPVEVEIKLSDALNAPISNALIFTSFYMLDYATGLNKPKLTQSDVPGTYRGIVFFSHEGQWIAAFTINLPNGDYEEVTLEIEGVRKQGA